MYKHIPLKKKCMESKIYVSIKTVYTETERTFIQSSKCSFFCGWFVMVLFLFGGSREVWIIFGIHPDFECVGGRNLQLQMR